MSPRSQHHVLRNEVERATLAALASEEPITKAKIARLFAESGVSRGLINRWIDSVITRVAVDEAIEAVKPTEPMKETKASAAARAIVSIESTQGAESRAAPTIRDAPNADAIPFLERLQANLMRLDAMMGIASKEDGSIKNTKLALDVVREIGVQLTRAARISATIQDMQAQQTFLRAMAEVIHQEDPIVRDRIMSKMRALDSDPYGLL